MNESEERYEVKTFPLYPYLLQGQQTLPNCKPVSVGCPGDVKNVGNPRDQMTRYTKFVTILAPHNVGFF